MTNYTDTTLDTFNIITYKNAIGRPFLVRYKDDKGNIHKGTVNPNGTVTINLKYNDKDDTDLADLFWLINNRNLIPDELKTKEDLSVAIPAIQKLEQEKQKLEVSIINQDKEIQRLQKLANEVPRYQAKVEAQEQREVELLAEIEDLKKKLSYYETPETPSSDNETLSIDKSSTKPNKK